VGALGKGGSGVENVTTVIEKVALGRCEGKVKWFNDKKGYGFILSSEGPDVFVHHTAIQMDGFRTLREGEDVAYDLIDGNKGLQAVNVSRTA
jgi:CspA family cold shock protein